MVWLLPTLLYVVAVGALGVTGNLALRTLRWPELILWTTVIYAAVGSALLVTRQATLRFTGDTGWAVFSGVLAIGGLIVLYVALGTGQVTKVVSVSAAYPAVTLVLSALFLSEGVTVGRVAGTALIIAGVVVVTLS